MFFPASKVGLRDITDGASNTLMVGERDWSCLCGRLGQSSES
ncbi:MAG: DUF1559 domain-containing protein [Planctomycetota bacterium]